MLLKTINIENFRQFKGNTELKFSTDPVKNVSIILGGNGSGKTSLAQAFTWALYGITDFNDSVMLNKAIVMSMIPGATDYVRVEVQLIHNKKDYIIRRVQQYRKKHDGSVQSSPADFVIAIKEKGQQEFTKNPELEIKQILPKELIGYFFLNGEHVEKLTKDLKKGKSKEFALAVENLLGLKAFLEAIEHFKPSKKYGVISKYNAEFDSNSNEDIAKLKQLIPKKQERINTIQTRIEESDKEIELGQEICNDLEKTIRENAKSAEYQASIDKLRKKIAHKEIRKKESTISLLKNFNNMGLPFIASSLVNDALSFIATEKIMDKGIPEIHERTIEYLIGRGSCICGTDIIQGELVYQNLIDLIAYIPPKSIGMVVHEFTSQCNILVKNGEGFFEPFKNGFSDIRSYQSEIDEYITEVEQLSKLIEGMKDIGKYQSNLSKETAKIQKLEDQKTDLNKELGVLEKELSEHTRDLTTLALQDKKNARIETYKAYAQEIFERLSYSYEIEEARVREKLQESINRIFREIYEGGMSISVDEKYRIKVTIDEVHGFTSEIETSTAQSTSVIFAFIAGIIELAKNFSSVQGVQQNLLAASEPYPLVMDAPLSNFDKRRIKTVCDTLPKVAEQVIILIKDTDGDLAEQYMGSIIGKKYRLEKINEVETQIVSG